MVEGGCKNPKQTVLLHRISRKKACKYASVVCNAARASVATGACLGYARRG
jgi:hypothetical protein